MTPVSSAGASVIPVLIVSHHLEAGFVLRLLDEGGGAVG
jgi:hypothetical protein